ncbi:MAG: hypothetical protein ACYDD4_04020 [Acidimicrobiales bacterium]
MKNGDIEPRGGGDMLDEALDLDLAASTLRANSADVSILLEALARDLAEALGSRLTVERQRGLLKRGGPIRTLRITLGEDELGAELAGASVQCTIGHNSGGIRIRTERVDMQQWLKRLLEALRRDAAHSDAARLALEHIVIGGS